MKNKKTFVASVTVVVILAATGISLMMHGSSETNEEGKKPSLLDATVEDGIQDETDAVEEQIDTYLGNLYTNSVYDSSEVEKGKYVKFAEGSVFIVSEGTMSAECEKDFINVTDGTTANSGSTMLNNNLYVITQDGDALFADTDAKFFVKGGFQITDSIKE